MKIYLEYFRRSGKWYSDGSYETSVEHLDGIWDEVREKRDKGDLPGLVEGAGKEFIISVDVPDHEHCHPRLIT